MRAHSPGQSAHSAQNQPAIERRGDCASFILNVANALEKVVVLFRDQNSAQNVAMAAKIFCGGMQNQIGAEIEWSLKNRRPGIIADANRVHVVNDFADRRKI